MRLSRKAELGILIGAYLTASTACTVLATRGYIAGRTSQIPQNYLLEERARARVEAMDRASESYSRLTPEEIALGIIYISKSREEISP
ncbi:hypothetical protein J4442_02715 [Candidatus Woesearchaeota archaeon]|nr:hypothetical protein [Candidatus Woesearchaeota archaeon]